MKKFTILILIMLLAACNPEPLPTLQPVPSETAEVTDVPDLPTSTAIPTETTTERPTEVPSATSTKTSTPTVIPTETATATLLPTDWPTREINTHTPVPTRVVQRDCNRLSYNINGAELPERTHLSQHLARLNPCVILVMNGFGLAMELMREYPDAIIVHREYSPAEGEEWMQGTDYWMRKWLTEAATYGPDSYKIWRHTANEPGQWNVNAYVQAEVAILNEAARRGFKVVCCHFSSGSWHPQAVDNGLYDPLIRAVIQGGHLFGVHEYTTANLAWGFGTMPREWLLQPEFMQKQHWPNEIIQTRIPFPAQAQTTDPDDPLPFGLEQMYGAYQFNVSAQSANGMLPPHWHLGRSIWFQIRSREIGAGELQFILTESFWDNMSDIGDSTLQPLRDLFGLDKYMRDMRGINSYPNLWRFYWQDWSTAKAACEQLLYVDKLYPDFYLGFTQFTWSSNQDWISFDMSGRQAGYLKELHTMIEMENCNV